MAKHGNKTHKGMAKRLKVTKKKKLIHDKAGNNHLLIRKDKSQRKSPYGRALSGGNERNARALLRI